MPSRYTLVCDDDTAGEVRRLAREYDLTEEEVLRQLVEQGLRAVEDGDRTRP